ncbi:MAG: sigma-70 family RNA polymerase sigma factor [Emergencia sp.]|nr:sigma-70 family RNA polymerase sigma factor [Emergencia sp.]
MRDERQLQRAIELYADMVRRICFLHLQNQADSEDVAQDVFLKYALEPGSFHDAHHEKAWLIRVTINACKDMKKKLFRHQTLPLEALSEEAAALQPEDNDVLEAVLSLPAKYKDVIYLYYYEGYSAAEIGGLLGKKENTVYSLLSRGRTLLKKLLGGEELG